jgi:tripeptidyl-peptidase-1
VDELVKPSSDTLSLVKDWLAEHDIREWSASSSSNWINVPLSIKQIERLLDTEYHIFEHEDGSRLVRTDSWSLPAHLHDHISTIQPTNTFFRAMPEVSLAKRSNDLMPIGDFHGAPFGPGHFPMRPPPYVPTNPNISQACNFSLVTPTCLRTLYGTYSYKPRAAGVNKVGMNNFLGEISNRSDVRQFLNMYRPEAVAAADQFTFQSIANGTTQQTQLSGLHR